MRATLALSNIVHHGARAVLSVAGLALAVLLVYMQLGFYRSCEVSATRVYDLFAFDAALVSSQYFGISDSGTIPRTRLLQAASVQGVDSVAPVYVEFSRWLEPRTRRSIEVLIFGADPASQHFFVPAGLRDLSPLRRAGTVIADLEISPLYSSLSPGIVTEVGERKLEVVGGYRSGPGFAAKAVLVGSDHTFTALTDHPLNRVHLALLQIDNRAPLQEVLARIRERLPPDTQVHSRRHIEARERHYWMAVKPIGIMFTSGILIAGLVSGVILYQILSTQVRNHLGEYATLEAIGWTPHRIKALVVEEGLVYALLGYLIASAGADLLYRVLRKATSLPMDLNPARLITVLVLTLAVAALSSLLAVRQLGRTDPAELF